MSASSAYDQRQYRQMLHMIDAYERDQIGLATLTSNLEALLECLEHPSEDWPQAFQSEWSVLEQVYASTDDQLTSQLNRQDKNILNKAIVELRKLILSQTL